AAFEGGGRVAPERAHHLDSLRDPGAALVVWDAAGLELLGVLPAHTDAEDEPAARQRVERPGDLGRHRGMAESQEIDRAAELDPPRDAGVGGEQRQRLVD